MSRHRWRALPGPPGRGLVVAADPVAEHVHALRLLPYPQLRQQAAARIGAVLVQVYDGAAAGRLRPVGGELILAGPDGELVGDVHPGGRGQRSGPSCRPRWLPLVGLVGPVVATVLLAGLLLLS